MQVGQQQPATTYPPKLPDAPVANSIVSYPPVDVEAAARYPELVFGHTNGTAAATTQPAAVPAIAGPSKIPSPPRNLSAGSAQPAVAAPPAMMFPAVEPSAPALAVPPDMQAPPATAIPSPRAPVVNSLPSTPQNVASFPVEPSPDSPPSPQAIAQQSVVSYPPMGAVPPPDAASVPSNLPTQDAAKMGTAPLDTSVPQATSDPPQAASAAEPVQSASDPFNLPEQVYEPVATPVASNRTLGTDAGVTAGDSIGTCTAQAQTGAAAVDPAKVCDADTNGNKVDALKGGSEAADAPEDGTRGFDDGSNTRGYKGGFSSRFKRFLQRELMRMVCGGSGSKWGRRRRRKQNYGGWGGYNNYGGGYNNYGGGYGGYGGGHGGYGGGYGGPGGCGYNGHGHGYNHGHGHGHGHGHNHGHGHGRPPRRNRR